MMRYVVGFLILCEVGLAAFSLGCGKDCGQAGCSDEVRVSLVPEIEVNYDVTLMLDGEAEAFACVRYYDDLREAWLWRMQPPYGISSCDGKGFLWSFGFNGTGTVPGSVEITVNARCSHGFHFEPEHPAVSASAASSGSNLMRAGYQISPSPVVTCSRSTRSKPG